jgi:hypothetical protein
MRSRSFDSDPLKLQLRVLEAERERLQADFDYIRGRLAAVDDEIRQVRDTLDKKDQRRQLKRIK